MLDRGAEQGEDEVCVCVCVTRIARIVSLSPRLSALLCCTSSCFLNVAQKSAARGAPQGVARRTRGIAWEVTESRL